ncbi:MAG: 4-hydroxy-tetrahydrodipicolinate reductase [Paludibacteraceae bacterium]|nr:4-hydroxy-tetrahydrodipicolinate reductase [Paludibacteraceae bacterium]
MNIALIGYGKMGKMIEEIAVSRGHKIVCKIDLFEKGSFDSLEFDSADVAIEFSVPNAAFDNYMKCFAHNKPVVAGTTGWLDKMGEIKKMCEGGKQTFFYASNYSLGVNVFFEVNRHLAKIMNQYDQYAPALAETHHIHKLDAPSGTAITLADDVVNNIDRVEGWTLVPELKPNYMPVSAIRRYEVPGIHTVRYDSEYDFIEITHSANTRRGFALGAVVAAEFAHDKKGFLGMQDMLKF